MGPEYPAYDAIIPAGVRYDPALRPNAKLLYGEIRALASRDGYCWATNAYFADLYGISQKTVSELIGTLVKRGHVWVETERDVRTNEVIRRQLWVSAAMYAAAKKAASNPKIGGGGALEPLVLQGAADAPIPKNRGRSPGKSGDPIPKNREDYIKSNSTRENIPPLSPEWERTAIEGSGLPDTVKQAVYSWVGYKREDKHDSYKPRGLQALLKKASQCSGQYGAMAVAGVIEESMASGYKGITWDRLRFQAPVERKAKVEERGQVNDW